MASSAVIEPNFKKKKGKGKSIWSVKVKRSISEKLIEDNSPGN